nr:centromere-associated protein E-like isoform X2 [Oncorhynchus nerka]
MAEESAVKVCVRVRPLIEREETAAESAEPVKFYWKTDKKTIHQVDDGNLTKNFSFDRVFSAEETTLQLYQELAKPLVVSAVEGYNGTIFAYGQTSSGKTFTMMGSSLTPGVIPLAMEDVFQTIKNCPKKEFLLRVSYLEIYNETVTDLLCDNWKRKPLEIREGNNKNVYVADLTEELVTSPEQALAWIRKGEKNRHYGKTKMNQRSSRSHTIFRMILESRDSGDSASGENSDCAIIVSHLNLVDLAGTERASQTGAEGTRFKEGCNINRSLFTLGQVIKKLSDETQKGFTNYRDSKLTRILQNSLGGNAKTVIICTITPVTLEETLSTLQFASAAKNMKNDPHVTEVSDDGALLRRYRNEIVELKRRLLEVSSVTQTTATEKETLSQILQEKDQLQREQADRYKNLAKLLVTSENFVTIKKMPKRRVTWGGKLPSPAFHHAGESDLSFAEPFLKKRKADMSVLTEQNEDGEEFDSTFDMEMNQSNLTMRGFAESEFLSPNQLNKLSEKVSCLELQLENETQQKQEAMEEVETFQRRVVELEKQLEEKSLMPADAQLDNETQQNQEAMEKVATFEMRVAELEKQLEHSQMPADAQDQMKKGFEETIQLCETLVSEKEMVATERDCLKQELNILMEQTEKLKKEKAVLLQEMEEKKELDEFKSLEEESKREYEKELLNDISSLKKAMEASGRKSQELESNLVAMSEELKKKGDWAEELQRSSDVDLVQQVKQLRRSLDDAEGLSRDTKKEWAHLRSENISLKERAVTLTAGYERMEAQVNVLRHQLEAEKSSFKKMEVDLQRELQGAFEENTKLTTLLDGKVPKNLIDRIELEKTVADLKKELEKSHEDERTLQAKIEDLSALQDLPDKVNSFMKQVCDLTEDLCAVQKERDMLVSAKACSEEEAHQFREHVQSSQEQLVKLQGDLSKAELRENDLTQQCTDITEQLETLRKDLARSSLENSQLLSTVEESSLRLKENEQYRASIEDQLCGMQQVMKELEEKLADSESSKEKYDNLSQEHQDQIRQLSEEVIQVQAELKRQQHLNSEQQSCAQQDDQHQLQIQELRAALETMTEERSQLNSDLQQNMEMAAETQGLLHSIQEELRQQKQVNSDLESQSLQKESLLEQQAKQLNEELESVRAERERLLSEKTDRSQNHAEELEKLLSTVTSLTGERDQLQEILEGIREERNQLKRDLEDKVELQLEEEGTHMRDERAQIQGDLQENMEMVIQVQRTLEQQQRLNSQQQAEREQHEDKLKQQMKQLEEECKGFKEGQFHFKVEADTSHKMLSDANATISILTEQINNLEQSTSCSTTRAGEGLCSRLEGSMQKFQVSLVRLQLVINGASKPGHGPLVDVTQVEEVMILKLLPLLPKPTQKIYSNINRSTVQITNTVWDTKVLLKLCAKDYKTHIEALVQNDLAVFEERRLQDLLLCRAQAPSHSVKVVENDLLGVWDERLSELLDRREGYLQKMNSVLKKLEESLAAHPAAVSEELRARERSNEELNALCMVHSPDSAAVENFLERELARRSALAQANTLALQGLRDERCGLLKELGVVRAQADSQLKEERSKTSTLLQILERASVKTEADLLRDNQQLTLKRQQLDGEIKEMQMRVDQLEEDQIKAANSVSNHKQATQLLQTELQDACAQVKDREGSIQVLKEKLRETEVLAKRRASPSALQHEELKAKVLKMELEMTASSSKHQEELLRMTTVLNHKEDALRTLKETLRRSQQEGEQSFNEGQDLHARLITARGRTIQSNILLEKNKLEEELKRLQSKISELESLVFTQQGEITKWKARAIKLKEKKRDVVDKPLSPCTPTKHRLPMNSEQFLNSPKRFLNSPKKLIDSPKKFLDSPKSKFFDVRSGSESMSINCPKQFFDNSNLGTIQEVAGIPISEIEAAGSAEEGNWCNLCVWDKCYC